MALPQRPLGRSGLRVGVVGLGTVKLGRLEGLKHPDRPAALPTDEEALALLEKAQRLGVTLLDTAPAYGVAEERLGRLLKGRRDRWTICTKAGERFEAGRSRFDFSPRALAASLEASLRRLRTDRVELLLVHSDGGAEGELARDETIDALLALKRAGKALLVGASVKTPAGARRCVELLDAAMVELSPRATAMLEVMEEAAARSCAILIKKALASGWIAREAAQRSAASGAPPDQARRAAAAEAVRFALAPQAVSCVVVGTTNPQHLQEAVEAASGRARAR